MGSRTCCRLDRSSQSNPKLNKVQPSGEVVWVVAVEDVMVCVVFVYVLVLVLEVVVLDSVVVVVWDVEVAVVNVSVVEVTDVELCVLVVLDTVKVVVDDKVDNVGVVVLGTS